MNFAALVPKGGCTFITLSNTKSNNFQMRYCCSGGGGHPPVVYHQIVYRVPHILTGNAGGTLSKLHPALLCVS